MAPSLKEVVKNLAMIAHAWHSMPPSDVDVHAPTDASEAGISMPAFPRPDGWEELLGLLEDVGAILMDAAGMAEVAEEGATSGMPVTLPVVRSLHARLLGVGVGGFVASCGGWNDMDGGHAVMYVWERTGEDTFDFVVCNAGEGVRYHDSSAKEYPKAKRRTALCISDVPQARATHPAFLYLLVQLFTSRKASNSARVLYDVLLPFLEDGGAWPEGPPQLAALPTSGDGDGGVVAASGDGGVATPLAGCQGEPRGDAREV